MCPIVDYVFSWHNKCIFYYGIGLVINLLNYLINIIFKVLNRFDGVSYQIFLKLWDLNRFDW